MGNPFLERNERTKNLTNSHKRSRKQEKEVARRLGAKTVRGSGSGEEKGDVRKRRVVRVECKTTKNKSFSITQEMLDKIEDAAVMADELPIIVVEMNDGFGKKLREVVVCPSYVLDCFVQE